MELAAYLAVAKVSSAALALLALGGAAAHASGRRIEARCRLGRRPGRSTRRDDEPPHGLCRTSVP